MRNPADGYVPMFNGKDLTGWVNVNCAPGTFFVKDGEIITTGKPTGFLRTEKQYENFDRSKWTGCTSTRRRSGTPGSSSGATRSRRSAPGYTRGIEVQVLVNLEYRDKKTNAITATSHGDLFSIWGATCVPDRPHPTGWARCLPSENRAKGGGEWNHYKVIANDGSHQTARQRQGSVRREQVQPAQGLPRAGERGRRVPFQEPQDQGTAEHQPEARGDRQGSGGTHKRSSTAWTWPVGKLKTVPGK
jgi:hypothetical protein